MNVIESISTSAVLVVFMAPAQAANPNLASTPRLINGTASILHLDWSNVGNGNVSIVIERQSEHKSRADILRALHEIRARIVASGIPLLDWEGVAQEKARARNFKPGV